MGVEQASAAAALRQTAEAISLTFAPCERACFEVGARLGDAIPGLTDLAGLFETLSQSLDSEEFRNAGANLQGVADQIKAAANELTGEKEALAELAKLNEAIAERISELLESSRTIAVLVFNVKIEAASLVDAGSDMQGFADGLQQLARRAQQALAEYHSTHGKLYSLLRSSCAAQIGFQERHQAALLAIADEIAASVSAVANRRREAAGPLLQIGQQSQQIGAQIGRCVMALQVGDSTRQRIEHAHQALQLAAASLDDDQGDGVWGEFGESVDVETRAAIGAGICGLQSRQLDQSLQDFSVEVDTINGALQGLAADAGKLATQGQTLFGAEGGDDGSFLEGLERKLEAARVIVEECRQARTVVDNTIAAVVATMSDLEQRTAGLSEIIVDVTIIGTNALLKSSRLGDRGKGLSVIAQELRNYAAKVVQGVSDLPGVLREVVAFVERFLAAGRARGAGQLTALDKRMLSAIGSFQANAKTMTEALARLDQVTSAVEGMLDGAARQLAANCADIGASLLRAVADIDEVETRIATPGGSPVACARFFDRMLRGAYTMAREREICDAFIADAFPGAPSNHADLVHAGAAGGGPDGDDYLF